MVVAECRYNKQLGWKITHNDEVEGNEEVLQTDVQTDLTKRLNAGVGCTEEGNTGAGLDIGAHCGRKNVFVNEGKSSGGVDGKDMREHFVDGSAKLRMYAVGG